MAVERPRRREFAELVSDHLFRDEHRDVLVTVVDAERDPDELRQDGRAAAPDLDDVRAAGAARRVGFLQEIAVYERPFPDRAGHGLALVLAFVARGDDEPVRGLVRTSLLSLGRLAPWAHRMAAARGLALAAAMGMVDRVHRHAAIMRPLTEPAIAARLAKRCIHVIGIRHRADGGEALAMHETLLAGAEAERDIALIASDYLRISARRSRDRTAPAYLQFDVVDDRADRDGGERHRIARLDVDSCARHDLVADRQPLRRDDIGLLAVGVTDQRDEAGPVRVVFHPLDLADDVELATLEIDDAIGLLVSAAAEANGNAAGVVSAALLGLADGQRLQRLALIELAAIDDGQLANARRRRIVCLESHGDEPLNAAGDVDAVAVGERHDGLLDVLLLAAHAAKNLALAFAQQRVHRRHLDVEQLLYRRLDLRFGRLAAHLEHELVAVRGDRRLFRDDRRDDQVVVARIPAHLNRASSASIAALVSTSLPRRMMSKTFAPCTGSTSTSGRLRAAAANFASTSAPSMISTLCSDVLAKDSRSVLVLASASCACSQTISSPERTLADSAWRSASARTFLGRSCSWLRTTGPIARPPPRNCGTRPEP